MTYKEMGRLLQNALESSGDWLCTNCPYPNMGYTTKNCKRCHKFLFKEITDENSYYDSYLRIRIRCPCTAYGRNDARKLAWLALERRKLLNDSEK